MKAGGTEAEWEDAYALDPDSGRFAVADGASASVRASEWASCLVEGFLSDPFDLGDAADLGAWIERRCVEFAPWHRDIAAEEMNTANWVRLAASAQPSYATFLAVELEGRATGETTVGWSGVGDCCLLTIRDHELLCSAPMGPGDGFDTHPDLISSAVELAWATAGRSFRGETVVMPGDLLLMMTDALAEWTLSSPESGPAPWDMLARVDRGDDRGFAELIDDLRGRELIANDDVTLLLFRVGDTAGQPRR